MSNWVVCKIHVKKFLPFVIIVNVPLNINKQRLGNEAVFLSNNVEDFLTNQEKSLRVQSRLQTYVNILHQWLVIKINIFYNFSLLFKYICNSK